MKRSDKELRFTRSRQAAPFIAAGLALLCLTVWLGVLRWHQITWKPGLWMIIAAGLLCAAAWYLSWRMLRHAFLILSPVGVEIFPLLLPVKRFQLVTWGEIAHAEVAQENRLLILTLAGLKDAKIIISLDPLSARARPLLARAIEGIAEKRAEAAAEGSA